MFARFVAVILFVMSGMWFAAQPGWESALAFVTFGLGYVGVEIAQHRKDKKKREDGEHISSSKLLSKRAEKPDEDLSIDALSILRLAVSEYPKRLLSEEFQKRCGLDRLHVDMAILELQKRGFLGEPYAHLWNTRDPNPNQPRTGSYPLLENGARYVEKKKLAQPGAGDNPVGAQTSRKSSC
jgi:hypothetical protein